MKDSMEGILAQSIDFGVAEKMGVETAIEIVVEIAG